ncbi:MAG: LytTR family transcriptional regulator DNA-binding domain-containing protein [Candidatus Competibacteraceae bacterium]|nr:LytTR family transcriptional regulator DNA-binding domain-containing protein [Candidatus Competibacteraceae bacterium]
MTKVGILDDEALICETLQKYLTELGYEVPDYALQYDEAIAMLQNNPPDIFLLDINIGGEKSGIDLGAYIRKHHNMPLIFISSYSDSQTIKSAAVVKPNGYLVKPFTRNEIFAAIETALSNFSSTPFLGVDSSIKVVSNAIFIKQDSLFVKVKFDDILFIKSDGVYIEIHQKDKKYLIRETMKNMLDTLPSTDFIQAHRSYIVNVHHIDAFHSEYVLIKDQTIPVSRSQRDELMQRFNLL